MKSAIRSGEIINLLKPFFLSVVLTFFGTVALAEDDPQIVAVLQSDSPIQIKYTSGLSLKKLSHSLFKIRSIAYKMWTFASSPKIYIYPPPNAFQKGRGVFAGSLFEQNSMQRLTGVPSPISGSGGTVGSGWAGIEKCTKLESLECANLPLGWHQRRCFYNPCGGTLGLLKCNGQWRTGMAQSKRLWTDKAGLHGWLGTISWLCLKATSGCNNCWNLISQGLLTVDIKNNKHKMSL